MGLPTLLKLTVALLVATGLSAFLVAGISADDENEEAVAARALQPTEVVAEIPEGYNELFELQWGGGSLHQLKGRLATMGCMANTIWHYGNSQWNVYNQYNIPQDNPIIQQFKQQYEQFIPAGALWANCYNICELEGIGCAFYEEIQKNNQQSLVMPSYVQQNLPCTQDFDPRVKEYVLSRIPHNTDICIIQQTGVSFGAIFTQHIIRHSIIFVSSSEYVRNIKVALKIEIHELCHATQRWHWLQQLSSHMGRIYNIHLSTSFNMSDYGKKFIDLIGFTQTDFGEGKLPSDSIYKDIYHKNPAELSAELCSMYLLDAMGEPSSYEYEKYNSTTGRYIQLSQRREFDVSTYLTPQIREWLETYMILPDVSE